MWYGDVVVWCRASKLLVLEELLGYIHMEDGSQKARLKEGAVQRLLSAVWGL